MPKAVLPQSRCKTDPSIERVTVEGFKFPLGVYPVEPLEPKAGYAAFFEPADGSAEDGVEWEEWPDRYVFDAVVSAERIEPLCRALFAMLKGRVYPILDVLGHDAYREIDPYISYELLGVDRFLESVRRYRDLFYEDGLCGFGAMTEEPFFYVFVDEHKIVTVRADPAVKERVEKVLHAFDLRQIEDPAGADAAAHEHRGVLATPDRRPDLLSFDEIVERLRDEWRLVLNVNARANLDEQGNDLGETYWRCEVRCWDESDTPPRYAEVILAARNLEIAEETAGEAIERLESGRDSEWPEVVVIVSDRLRPEQLADHGASDPDAEGKKASPPVKEGADPDENPETGRIISARWLE